MLKNSPLEGGIEPFIASWPGKIKSGIINNELVVNTDLVVTFAALVGKQLNSNQAMDSRNILPILTGKNKK